MMVKISFANDGYDPFMATQLPGPARVKTTEKIRSGTFTADTSMEAGVNCVNDLGMSF